MYFFLGALRVNTRFHCLTQTIEYDDPCSITLKPFGKGAYLNIVCFFLSQNICCGYSKEQSQGEFFIFVTFSEGDLSHFTTKVNGFKVFYVENTYSFRLIL